MLCTLLLTVFAAPTPITGLRYIYTSAQHDGVRAIPSVYVFEGGKSHRIAQEAVLGNYVVSWRGHSIMRSDGRVFSISKDLRAIYRFKVPLAVANACVESGEYYVSGNGKNLVVSDVNRALIKAATPSWVAQKINWHLATTVLRGRNAVSSYLSNLIWLGDSIYFSVPSREDQNAASGLMFPETVKLSIGKKGTASIGPGVPIVSPTGHSVFRIELGPGPRTHILEETKKEIRWSGNDHPTALGFHKLGFVIVFIKGADLSIYQFDSAGRVLSLNSLPRRSFVNLPRRVSIL
jgi:hypothetical protein